MDLHKVAEFVISAHEGQVDKGGIPYFLHPFTVASNLNGYGGDIGIISAMLHDILEDTKYTKESLVITLAYLGLSSSEVDEVMEVVLALTKTKEEPYANYLDRITESGLLAVKVKIADLSHNLDVNRIAYAYQNGWIDAFEYHMRNRKHLNRLLDWWEDNA